MFVLGVIQCAAGTDTQPNFVDDLGGWVNKFAGFGKVAVMVFLAATFGVLWKTRNRACFDHILCQMTPLELFFISQLVDTVLTCRNQWWEKGLPSRN